MRLLPDHLRESLSLLYERTREGEWFLTMKDAEGIAHLAHRLERWAMIGPASDELMPAAKALEKMLWTRELDIHAKLRWSATVDDHEVEFFVGLYSESITLRLTGLSTELTQNGRTIDHNISIELTSRGGFPSRKLARWLDRAAETDKTGDVLIREMFIIPFE